MPPKSSKGNKKKSHPYQGGDRRSARQVVLATREETIHAEDGTQVRDNPVEQPPTPSTSSGGAQQVDIQPVPSVPHQQPMEAQTSQQQAIPSTSTQPILLPIPSTSAAILPGEPVVSRQEFLDLKESFVSMKNSMSNFFSSFESRYPSNPPQSAARPSAAAGSPIPVLVSQGDQVPVRVEQSPANSMVDQVVQQAVHQHVKAITQGIAGGKTISDKPSLQVDRKVSTKLTQDIWENKYVDFQELLDKKQDSFQPLQLVISETGEQQWVPLRTTKEISSIGQWSRAFDIYLSVYSRKFPEQTHNLLTYSTRIKDLAFNNGDYLRYDREFRISRARYNVPWEIPNLELWYQCSQAGLKNQLDKVTNIVKNNDQPFHATNAANTSAASLQPQPNKPKLKHPTGFCFTYHNKGRCGRGNCRFSHSCYAPGCNQEHPAYTCPLITKSSTSPLLSDTTGAAKTKPASNSHTSS